ncbi:MAG: adenylate/guanylate cyclase domain-containing protein [Actinomycetota bacterium]
MAESICPSCGAENPDGFRFCGSCGTTLDVACAVCGAANPPGNRFCGSCGSALEPGATTTDAAAAAAIPAVEPLQERKVVTSLFADLAASTELATRLDPEDLRRVLEPFFSAMTEEIERFGGTVEKFIGDAVVAFFGVPFAHEDDPERAVRAALAMQRRLGELNVDLGERAGGDLAMRIGINTGEVFAHGGGNDEGLVTGEAVNIAARFQALAPPGRVVVGERTWRDTRRAFSFVALGEVEVKGVDRPLGAYEVDEELQARRSRPAELAAPMVGRRAELDLLRLLFDRAVREGRPSLATIVGPPGIGKSRLSHEIASALEADGARVVRGRCLPYGDGLTYWPLAEILKADAGISDSDPASTIEGKARAVLEPRLGDGEDAMGVAAVLLSSIGVMVESDPLAGVEPTAAERVIARAWQRYMESLTADAPVVALIEDIHWADPRLLDLIEAVLSRASGAALVLCTARPELHGRHPDWGGGLANATAITLSPLSASEGTALIEHLLGGDAPAEVVGPILHRSEGNPFYAGELLRMMTEDGTLARRDGRWAIVRGLPSSLPDTVQGVIASRIDLLTPSEKRAIQDAAVVGRIFWEGALARLGADPSAIEGLVDKGFIWDREGSTIAGERELIFHHILTRDVAYAGIPKTRRADAHAVVGGWVEEVTGGRDEEFAEILAHHFGLAGDLARTARYAKLAGDRHRRVFAAEEAIRWYDRALESVDGADAVALEGAIALARGQAEELIGRLDAALEDYGRALAAARTSGDARLEADGLARTAHLYWILDRYDDGQALLPEALERARSVGAADLEAELLYTAGTIRFGRGEFQEALVLHRQGLEVATASADRERRSFAHHGLCETFCFAGPYDAGLEHGRAADALLRELGQRQMTLHNLYMVAWLEWLLGDPARALASVQASIADAREIGSRRDLTFALVTIVRLRLEEGSLGAALEAAEEAVAVARELGIPRAQLVSLTARASVQQELGDPACRASAEAASAISDELGGTFFRPPILAYLAASALERDDPTEAGRMLAAAYADAGTDWFHMGWAAHAAVLAGESAGDVGWLEEAAGRIAAVQGGAVTTWTVSERYARALSALLRERPEEALRLAEGAVPLAITMGLRAASWRLERIAWRALEELGRADEGSRRRATSAAILRDVLAAVPDEHRRRFLAKPLVADVLES